jgi:hypothetical protein
MPNDDSAPFTSLLRDHATAVQEFIAVASQVRGEAWHTPRAPDKWSPAQETQHLTLPMQAFVRDLRGRVTHPFFDQMTLEQFLRFAAVHARHHASFVRAALAHA